MARFSLKSGDGGLRWSRCFGDTGFDVGLA
jgi:hypothetical protein